jgi:hypothetical protein
LRSASAVFEKTRRSRQLRQQLAGRHFGNPKPRRALLREFQAFIPGDTAMGASVIISILITFLVVILVLYLVQRLPVDARMRQIIQIVVVIIGIVSLLKYLSVF